MIDPCNLAAKKSLEAIRALNYSELEDSKEQFCIIIFSMALYAFFQQPKEKKQIAELVHDEAQGNKYKEL